MDREQTRLPDSFEALWAAARPRQGCCLCGETGLPEETFAEVRGRRRQACLRD